MASLLLADDVVLLAPLCCDLLLLLDWFAAEDGVRINTSRSESTVLGRKRVEWYFGCEFYLIDVPSFIGILVW